MESPLKISSLFNKDSLSNLYNLLFPFGIFDLSVKKFLFVKSHNKTKKIIGIINCYITQLIADIRITYILFLNTI